MAYTQTWNSSFEDSPADNDAASEGALRIRNFKKAVRERIAHDHYFNTGGIDADHGEHKFVTLRVGAYAGSGEADKGIIKAKDINSKAELFYHDEDGNEVQLTSGGSLIITIGKTIGDTPKYEDDGSSNPVIDHPNKSAQRTSLGLGSLSTKSTASQSDLATSQGSVSTSTSGASLILPGGEYGFYPRVKGNLAAQIVVNENLASYRTHITLDALSGTVYAQQRYVTASGEVYWIFIAKAKSDGRILGTYQAPDHPCFGNGGNPDLVSYPFNRFRDSNDNLIDFEVLVINPDFETMKDLHARTPKSKDLMETLFAEYDIDEFIEPPWPDKYITVDVVNNDFPFATKDADATVIKQKIKKPDTVRTAGLKKKITKVETK